MKVEKLRRHTQCKQWKERIKTIKLYKDKRYDKTTQRYERDGWYPHKNNNKIVKIVLKTNEN